MIDKNDSLVNNFFNNSENGFFNEKFYLNPDLFKQIKNKFKIQLKQNNKVKKQIMTFSTFRPGITKNINNIDLALKQMSRYLLSNKERISLKGSSKKEKENLFLKFWEDRDPTPDTKYNEVMHEFYNRIDYVNEHFDSWQPGWETDRGQIYILFGPPDNIFRTQSFNSMSVSQTWEYYRINKKFVFIDQNGFGDFKLNTPFFGSNF